MAITPELRGTLSIVNKATAPLRAVMRDVMLMGRAFLEAGEEAKHGGHEAGEGAHEIARGAEHAEHAVERMGHSRGFLTLAGHVRILRGHLGGLNANLGEVQHTLREFLPALGGLAIAGGLAGLVEMTAKTAEVRGEMARTAASIGITTQQLVNLHTVAKLTDTPVEALDGAMQKLDKALGLAAIGKGKDTVKLLGAMHISLRDTHDQVRSAMDVFPQLAQAIMKTQSPALRMVIATKLMGKSSADLIPLMMRGKDSIEDLSREAANLNYAPSEEESRGLEEFHENQVKLETAVGSFRDAIGSKLGPVLAAIAPQWTALVEANRDWIATNIAEAVKGLSDALLRIDLKAIIADVKGWAAGTRDAAEAFRGATGLNPAVAAAAVVLGLPLLGPLRAAIGASKSLGSALLHIGRVTFGPAIAAAADFAKALYLTRDAGFALSFALNANPIGAIIGGVALLGAAAYELWQHWAQVKTFFAGLWAWFKTTTGWQLLQAIVAPLLLVPKLIYDNWTPIKAFFAGLWDDVAGVFEAAWARIRPIVEPLITAAGKIRGAVASAVDDVVGPLPGVHNARGLGQRPTAPSLPNLITPAAALPSVYARPGAGAAANMNGHVTVDVNLTGAPPGTTVKATSAGATAAPRIRTGPNLPAGAALAR